MLSEARPKSKENLVRILHLALVGNVSHEDILLIVMYVAKSRSRVTSWAGTVRLRRSSIETAKLRTIARMLDELGYRVT